MAVKLFMQSVLGASHISKNTPCEDFGLKAEGGEGKYKVFATADGHGDKNCTRSRIGSRLVCEIARDALLNFAECIEGENGIDALLTSKKEGDMRCRTLATYIAGKWIEAVSEELEQNPITDEELASATEYGAEYQRGIRVERMYGTTLMAGLLTDRYLLLLHQGDGRIVVFGGDGKAYQPVPWDDRCVGTATTSMCDPDAAQSFRYTVISLEETPVIACVAGSDGVEDSFPSSMEKTHSYYRDLLAYACNNGVEALEEYLKEELSTLSKERSQDDVTVSGFVDIDKIKPFLDSFKEQNRTVDIEDEVAVWEERVLSVESGGKFTHLKEKVENAKAAYEDIRAKYLALDKECKALTEEIERKKNDVDLNSGEVDTALNKAMENASDEEKGFLGKVFESFKSLVPTGVSKEDVIRSLEKKKAQRVRELNFLTAELDNRREALLEAEKEFAPVLERYEGYKQKRDEAKRRLTELGNIS
ncbi:MAG: protein phosphatase 2C domain-containing protein [Clostridia bacterium]|nr:protein phosphatase 2C domain-containing protein [Clostridia bacterium]